MAHGAMAKEDYEVKKEEYEMPLLCVKRTVLLPLDNSSHSERAFDYYVSNLSKPGDYVIFMTVVQPQYHMSVYGVPEAPCLVNEKFSKMMDKEVALGKKLCKAFMRKARKLNIMNKSYIRINSSPGEALVSACRDYNVNLIVIANRGGGLLRKTFLGSVSQYLLQHAHLPVVIVTNDKQVEEYDAKGIKQAKQSEAT